MRNKELRFYNPSTAPWQDTLVLELINGQQTTLDLSKLSPKERYDVGCLALANYMLKSIGLRLSSKEDVLKASRDVARIMDVCEIKRTTYLLVGFKVVWLLFKALIEAVVINVRNKFRSH